MKTIQEMVQKATGATGTLLTCSLVGIKEIEAFAALVRADEREQIAQMIEDAPPMVEAVTNDHGGCLMCGFTPKLAAKTIRARSNT